MIENKQKMMGKVHEFNKRYRDYFRGNINDKEMTEHVSQPFWHSLHMSKKRLDENGLHMEIDIKNVYEKTNRVAVMNPRMEQVNYEDGERISAGEFKQEVRVMKKIKKDNKVLLRQKIGNFAYKRHKSPGKRSVCCLSAMGTKAQSQVISMVVITVIQNSKYQILMKRYPVLVSNRMENEKYIVFA